MPTYISDEFGPEFLKTRVSVMLVIHQGTDILSDSNHPKSALNLILKEHLTLFLRERFYL